LRFTSSSGTDCLKKLRHCESKSKWRKYMVCELQQHCAKYQVRDFKV
jgi:hypothetical protein